MERYLIREPEECPYCDVLVDEWGICDYHLYLARVEGSLCQSDNTMHFYEERWAVNSISNCLTSFVEIFGVELLQEKNR